MGEIYIVKLRLIACAVNLRPADRGLDSLQGGVSEPRLNFLQGCNQSFSCS